MQRCVIDLRGGLQFRVHRQILVQIVDHTFEVRDQFAHLTRRIAAHVSLALLAAFVHSREVIRMLSNEIELMDSLDSSNPY